MDAATARTWTAAEIAARFDAFGRAEAEHREATAGPFNPFGDSGFDPLVWHGTIDEARSDRGWPKIDEDDGATPEEAALESAYSIVGSGRPVYVAFSDGAYPALFREVASEDEIRGTVWSFYAAIGSFHAEPPGEDF